LTPDTTYSGPYARAAHIYREAGWYPLPLGNGPAQKFPPPSGWTGHSAPYPSAGDVHAWTETHGDRNIGLRMPPGVIGLDVDHYRDKTGADTLAQLEAKFGPLPPTWVSSARPAPSGIRFYRIPHERAGVINWPGEAGKFIEIIQPGHRYAVVWPSINPEAAGAEYRWRHENPSTLREHLLVPRSGQLDTVEPRPQDLPALPVRWIEGLALPYERVDKATLGSEQYAQWWDGLR